MHAIPQHTRHLLERLLEAYCARICPPRKIASGSTNYGGSAEFRVPAAASPWRAFATGPATAAGYSTNETRQGDGVVTARWPLRAVFSSCCARSMPTRMVRSGAASTARACAGAVRRVAAPPAICATAKYSASRSAFLQHHVERERLTITAQLGAYACANRIGLQGVGKSRQTVHWFPIERQQHIPCTHTCACRR